MYVQNDTSIPLAFVDIYDDAAAYEDRHTPSFSYMLIAKGLARELSSNASIVSWYHSECDKLIESEATCSLRWVDVHEMQKPAICYAASPLHSLQPSPDSYVVGNVIAVPTPTPNFSTAANVARNKKKSSACQQPEALSRVEAEHLNRQKMERVDSWLKQDAHNRWKDFALKMSVIDTPVTPAARVARPANERPEVNASHTEGKPQKAYSNECYKPVDRKSSGSKASPILAPSPLPNCQQQKPARSQLYDAPERDVNRYEQCIPKQTKSSQDSRHAEEIQSLQFSGGRHNVHVRRESPGNRLERPLFMRDDNATTSPTCHSAEGSGSGGRLSPIPGDSGIQQKTAAEISLPASESTKAVYGETTESDAEATSVAKEDCMENEQGCVSSIVSDNAAYNEGTTHTLSSDLDNQPCLSLAEKHSNPSIPPCLLAPTVENISPVNLNASEDEICSESSSGLFTVGKHESDFYLSANETLSTVSVTPPRKLFASVSCERLPSETSPRDSRKVTDDDTVMSDNTVGTADMTKTILSHHLPPVKLVVTESRRIIVMISFIESPGRFWINVPSEQSALVSVVRLALLTI